MNKFFKILIVFLIVLIFFKITSSCPCSKNEGFAKKKKKKRRRKKKKKKKKKKSQLNIVKENESLPIVSSESTNINSKSSNTLSNMIDCSEKDDFLFITTKKEKGFEGRYGEDNVMDLPIRKWAANFINIKIYDYENIKDTKKELIDELIKIVNEINNLSSSVQLFLIDVNKLDKKENLMIYISSPDVFIQQTKEKNQFELSKSIYEGNKVINQGLFWFKFHPSLKSKILEAAVWVNDNLDSMNCKKHLLREELTQSLGMTNDFDDNMLDNDEKGSIFNQKYHCDPSYNNLDKRIIKTFLSPQIKPGDSAFKTTANLNKLLNCEVKSKPKNPKVIKKLESRNDNVSIFCEKCLKSICKYGENNISTRCSICNNEDSQILIKTFNKVCI